ncbi:MAG TPA: alpha/beta hydrolase-fold protein [Streptosporangiaceae bacterium]|nr:alpha/beta hydrolase-fold protein [Streptosporangiaceae bacterium]
MPEPQSTVFFLLLMVIFAALICWLILTRHAVFRVLAACLAFIPAVVFGVAAVNKYYNYYQSWSSAITDVTSQGVPGTGLPASPAAIAPTGPVGRGITRLLGNTVYTRLAAVHGFMLRLTVHGRASHLTRAVYVYLPPQYFQPAYRHYRFPAIELIHGYPGAPQDWITVLDITTTLANMISHGEAKPAVLVMPDANGAKGLSLQCLNSLSGPQDATFIASDVPGYVSQVLRVWPPGRTWAIAGYSEGGFCAANLGLQYGSHYGFAGVLSGYFRPFGNRMGQPAKLVDPFGHDPQLRRRNTPAKELLMLPPGARIPQFWIGSGTDRVDMRAAEVFRQLLQLRQPAVRLMLVPGGGHTMSTWRVLVPPMLEWMTPKLAENVKLVLARAKRVAQSPALGGPGHDRRRDHEYGEEAAMAGEIVHPAAGRSVVRPGRIRRPA